MKKLIAGVFILISFQSIALKKDSTKTNFFKNISAKLVWFEAARMFPLQEKTEGLSDDLSNYLGETKGNLAPSLLHLEFFYKNKIGVEVFYMLYNDISSKNNQFQDHITKQYGQTHFIPNVIPNSYSLSGLAYRVAYRFNLKHFSVTPKFQFGFNNYKTSNSSFTMKEKGSNQFIKYSINKENLKKRIIDYHLIVNVVRQFWMFDVGLKFEYMIVPTQFQYTITKKEYNMPADISSSIVSRYNPAIGIGLVAKFNFKESRYKTRTKTYTFK